MKVMLRFLGILGLIFLVLVIVDFFIGVKSSVYISKIDGALMYQKSVVFPSFTNNGISLELERRIEETGFSEFLKTEDDSSDERGEWSPAMYRVKGIISGEIRVSPTPDTSKMFPINEWNNERLLNFLRHESKENPKLALMLKRFFSNIEEPDRSFVNELNSKYVDWRREEFGDSRKDSGEVSSK